MPTDANVTENSEQNILKEHGIDDVMTHNMTSRENPYAYISSDLRLNLADPGNLIT